ncbi:hypothetical protein B484DRAFT_294713, partial [Ochromonadaceae sp. CCMP2298]
MRSLLSLLVFSSRHERARHVPKSALITATSTRMFASGTSESSETDSGGLLGIIFDMDGTLTEPNAIDFAAMYSRNGLIKHPTDDIVRMINRLPAEQRDKAMQVIEEEEMAGCERMVLRTHLMEILSAAGRANIRVALSTRNCDKAVQIFLRRAGLPQTVFSPMLHRDSLSVSKPDPAVARHVLEQWG